MGKGNKARSGGQRQADRFVATSLPSKRDTRTITDAPKQRDKSLKNNTHHAGGDRDVRPPSSKPSGKFDRAGKPVPINRLKKDYDVQHSPFQKDNFVCSADIQHIVTNPGVERLFEQVIIRVILRFWFSRLYVIDKSNNFRVRQHPIIPPFMVLPFFLYIHSHLDVPRVMETQKKIPIVVAQLSRLRSNLAEMIGLFNRFGPLIIPSGYVRISTSHRLYIHEFGTWELYDRVTPGSWVEYVECASKVRGNEQLNGANGSECGTDNHAMVYKCLVTDEYRGCRLGNGFLLGSTARAACIHMRQYNKCAFCPRGKCMSFRCDYPGIAHRITCTSCGARFDVRESRFPGPVRGEYPGMLSWDEVRAVNALLRLRRPLNGSHGEHTNTDDVKGGSWAGRGRKFASRGRVENTITDLTKAAILPDRSNRFSVLDEEITDCSFDPHSIEDRMDDVYDAYDMDPDLSFEERAEQLAKRVKESKRKVSTKKGRKTLRAILYREQVETNPLHRDDGGGKIGKGNCDVEMTEIRRDVNVMDETNIEHIPQTPSAPPMPPTDVPEVNISAPQKPQPPPVTNTTFSKVVTGGDKGVALPTTTPLNNRPALVASREPIILTGNRIRDAILRGDVDSDDEYDAPVVIPNNVAEDHDGSVDPTPPGFETTGKQFARVRSVRTRNFEPAAREPNVVGGGPCVKVGDVFTLAQGGYVINKMGTFSKVGKTWFNTTSGEELSVDVYEVPMMTSYASKIGTNLYVRTSPTGHRKRQLCLAESRVIPNFVVSSDAFKWFVNLRLFLREAGHFMTLGQYYRESMFTGMSTFRRDITISLPLLRRLYTKIGAALSELANTILLDVANRDIGSFDQQLILDTIVYFSVVRAESHKAVNGNQVATQKWAKNRVLWKKPGFPSYLDMSSTTKRVNMCEGAYKINDRMDAMRHFKEGVVSVDRLDYTKSDPSHGSFDNPTKKPGLMYHPFSEKEEARMHSAGIGWEDPFIRFPTRSCDNITTPYQSVCGGFATQSAIINHLDVEEVERAHLRLFTARDNEILKREITGQTYAMVELYMRHLRRDNRFNVNLKALEARIREDDEQYSGIEYNSLLYEQTFGEKLVLTKEQHRLAFVRACINVVQAEFDLAFTEERMFDDAQALSDYVDMIGTKLKLRRAGLDRLRSGLVDIIKVNRVNVVQMKPHEAQKYKIVDNNGVSMPVLKFGRDVVSITDDDWLKARPHLCCYMKKVLEELLEVEILEEHCTVSFGNVERGFIYPKECVYSSHRVVYKHRALLSSTDLCSLASAIYEMRTAVESDHDVVFGVSFGDDQLLTRFNRDSSKYGGKRGIVWLEGDIKDNDGSHVDSFYRMCYLVQCLRGEDAIEMFAQLARPVLITNPASFREFAIMRYLHGMRMCSGSAFTTMGNSIFSCDVMLMSCMHDSDDYVASSALLGVDVTFKLGDMEDVTFLSKNFYETGDVENPIGCYTDMASLLRSFGKVPGDFGGSSKQPITERYVQHTKQVVQSWVHEPSSALMEAMRHKYVTESVKYGEYREGQSRALGERCEFYLKKSLDYVLQTPARKRCVELENSSFALGPMDLVMLRHYYPEDLALGEAHYRALVSMVMQNDTFGTLIVSNFIDRVMDVRYGMASAVLA